jgi:hypothetical protein
MAGELGVGDVVRPVAEIARALVVPDQEVGVAAPPSVEERGLVDDVGAALHGIERQLLCRHQIVGSRDLGDVQRPAHLGEHRPLVRVAQPTDQVAARVVDLGTVAEAERDGAIQRRQVRAGEMPDQVGRAQHHASVDDVHTGHPLVDPIMPCASDKGRPTRRRRSLQCPCRVSVDTGSAHDRRMTLDVGAMYDMLGRAPYERQ